MKNFILRLLTSILVTLITILIINLNFKENIVNNIIFNSMKDTIFSNAGSEITELIEDNKEVSDIFSGFMDTVISEISDSNVDLSKIDKYDLEGKTIDFINNNKDTLDQMGINIDENTISEFSSKIKNQKISENVKDMITKTKESLPPEAQKALKIYEIITSTGIRNLLIIGIIIDVILIIVISFSFYKWIKNIAFAMIYGGVIPMGLAYAIKKIVYSRLNFDIDIKPMLKNSSYVVAGGVILLIVYIIIRIIVKRSERDDLSEIPNA